MILTDKTILEQIEKGEIVVSPFNRSNVGTNSIDLTLDPKMLVYKNASNYLLDIVDGFFNVEHIDERTAKYSYKKDDECNFIDCRSENETEEIIIPSEGFVLEPGQLYIASTNEYTETHNAVPVIEGKSSLGRLGLSIHITAGFGDVGFCGTWTLELVATVPLKIYPNMKICQISYHSISDKPLIKYDEKESAKYSGQIGATASLMHENFKK